MGRRLAAAAAFVTIGFAYGVATSYIPMPGHGAVSAFWLGNLCAPWLVLAFLAGRAQTAWARSGRVWAVCAGIVTDVACVSGFYARDFRLDARWGRDVNAAPPSPAAELQHWFQAHAQWFAAAVVAGALYGWFGHLWSRDRSRLAGLALATGFLAEPVIWPIYNGYYKGPWLIWAVEVAVGLAVAWRFIVITQRNPSYASG